MKRFAELIQQLELSNKTNDKIAALVDYFTTANEKDKPYVIAMFTGKRPRRPVNTSLIKQWAIELSGIPEWLFTESYHSVGDLSETIASVLPPANKQIDKPLHQWLSELAALQSQSDEEKKNYVLQAWGGLSTQERFIFNKLISGNFRIGVSNKMLVNAIAKQSNIESSKVMHAIMGKWSPSEITFQQLIEGEHVNTDNSWPYPFCLAYALDTDPENLGEPANWQAEWKWDGIRGQIIKRNGELFIWSRGEELVTDQFPELHFLKDELPDGTVLDGEILSIKEGHVQSFSTLQQRLNRKTINKSQLIDAPIGFYAYDLLEHGGLDIRLHTLNDRREILEKIIKNLNTRGVVLTSPVISFNTWENLAALRLTARELNSEGIMLKKMDSVFHAGRKRGDWWKCCGQDHHNASSALYIGAGDAEMAR